MDYVLTAHALEEMARRQIDLAWVERVIEAQGRIFLVRCVVEDWHNPPVVVTVYRTTKLAKYWRQP